MLHESKMSIFLFLVSLLISVSANALSIEQLSDNELQDLECGIQAMEQKKYELARQKLMPLAERGYPNSQVYIGWMHLRGVGTDVNVCEGVYWIDLAARQSFPDAQVMMANILSDAAWGHYPNYERSYGWLLQAIQNGITDMRSSAFTPLSGIQFLFEKLEKELDDEQRKKIKQTVADGKFDISVPASKYIVRFKEFHVGGNVINIPPCQPFLY